ncbi:cysteine/Histidine-rich C1 domain family protein [Striga asiatica]|uniref:Cysteine/Histidine-rich C1 domain family protein n=1 Tax=Striga asiatica TaxID=4170 RepID=A0A5A7RDM5_STRAF|nr:cysteine/Histidine-rich C1 domain family protein [Striga asiatica]
MVVTLTETADLSRRRLSEGMLCIRWQREVCRQREMGTAARDGDGGVDGGGGDLCCRWRRGLETNRGRRDWRGCVTGRRLAAAGGGLRLQVVVVDLSIRRCRFLLKPPPIATATIPPLASATPPPLAAATPPSPTHTHTVQVCDSAALLRPHTHRDRRLPKQPPYSSATGLQARRLQLSKYYLRTELRTTVQP